MSQHPRRAPLAGGEGMEEMIDDRLLCTVGREEVEPDAEPSCEGHTHAEGEYGGPGTRCRFNQLYAVCTLDGGHDGAHVFVPEPVS